MKQWLLRRGLLATLPVASLVLAFGACSSESGTAGGTSASNKAPQVDGLELATKPVATERVARLSKQFTRVPQQPAEPAAFKFPPGVVPPKAAPAKAPLPSSAVLSKGEAKSFVRQGERFRAQVDPYLKEKTSKPASVDLPASADGFVRVQPDRSNIGVEFSTKHANKRAEIEVADGIASYPSGAPEGGDMVFRVTADAVEDFVVLDKKPAHPSVSYAVNVSEVPGLRLYDNTLEFLDAKGDPQIRVKPPRVVDADGVIHEAQLSVAGCKFDSSGLVPWDRPVTAPGAAECTLNVGWDDTNVIYPAIVDPVWATAGSLATARTNSAAVRLPTGFVLTCGGVGDLGIPIKSCETFNPAGGAGAGTWAAATAMSTARNDFTLFVLSPASTDVLAVGGNGVYTSERLSGAVWTASTGDFSGIPVGCPSCGPQYFSPAQPMLTSDGNYVVVVDYQSTPYRFSTATNAWTTGTINPSPQQQYRYNAIFFSIPGQATIMRLGGYYSSTHFATGERYKPSTDSWSAPGNPASMTVTRRDAAVATLDANRVMVYGGYTGSAYSSTAEIYNASNNTWAFTTGQMPNGYSAYQGSRGVTFAFHGSGKLLLNTDGGTYIYDPTASTFSVVQPNFNDLGSQGNVIAAGGKVLVTPVWPTSGPSGAQTACRLFDFGDKGSQCSSTVECQATLTCVKDGQYDQFGVCCDTACTGACNSCQATHKQSGTGDGTCGGRKTSESVSDTACPYTDPTTCGTSGYTCDGLGGCAKWPTSQQCGNSGCSDTDTQNNTRYCDGKGVCAAQTTTDCTAGYKCTANQSGCVTYCYDQSSYCTASYYCQTWYDQANPANGNKCFPQKDNGSACSGNSSSECKSGYCVDGVCCDAACDGTCQACTTALTGKTTGTCKPITLNTDPQGDCGDFGSATCGQNGVCNGAGACQLYASGTLCADIGSCASETARYIPDVCDGAGTCVDKGSQACNAGYACNAGVCQTQCTTDTQCASANYCDIPNKICVPDKKQGQTCLRDQACEGNSNCVEIDAITKLGVCCNSGCAGDCQSCLKVNNGVSDGTCSNVSDDLDPKNKCAIGAAYPNSCAAPGLCNGQGACRPYAKDTVECDTDSCADSTLTSYTCNGAGTCKARATQCYPFKCDTANNTCRIACSVDAHCVTGSFCKNGTCVGQLANGSACSDGAQCKSTHCANIHEGVLQDDIPTGAGGDGSGGAGNDPGADAPGVCCDSDCQGTCSGCKASIKGFGSDGVCEFVKNNTDPANDCDKAGGDLCGLDGQCNGAGACRLSPSGTSCGASSCQGNSVLGQSCNGQGDCINNQGGIDCAPYVCRDVEGAFQCTNPCATDNDCQDGYFCSDAKCSKKLANGKACDSSGICGSGYCVDGLCCDTSCNGQCEACDSAGNEGTCSPVQGDPHGTRAKCDHSGEECGGLCDGVNASSCKYAATGTTCGDTSCDSDLAKSSACDGQGSCKANKDTECSPYTCGDDNGCLSRCQQDLDCSQGYACDETTQRCLPSAVAATCSDDRLTSVGQNGQNTPCKPFLCVPASGTCAFSCAFTTDCAPDFVCEPSTKTCLPAPTGAGTADDQSCACRAAGAAPDRSGPGYWALAAFGIALSGLRRRKRNRSSRSSTKPTSFGLNSQPLE